MASDLPDSHSSPMAMVRCLVTYISDVDRIYRVVKAEFGTSPCHHAIGEARRLFLSPDRIDLDGPHKPHEGYYPDEVSSRAADANQRFLIALKREREYSEALKSLFLTRPQLVNHRFDCEFDAAVREAMA
jgi:hypothetical protein